MNPMTPEALIDTLSWRYATKVFDPARKVPPALWSALEKSLVLTPTSFGLQPYRFIVVTDPKLQAKLKPASWGQGQITECSHLVIFAAKQVLTTGDVDHYIQRIAEVRHLKPEDLASYRDMMTGTLVTGPRAATVPEWAARQTYIALGQFMASAALLGLDSCPMEGLDPVQYDKILDLEGTPFHTVMACAVGYRAKEDKYSALAKVRFPAGELMEYR